MAVYYTLNVLSGMNKLHLIFNVKHMLVIYYFQRTYIKSLVKYFPVCETLSAKSIENNYAFNFSLSNNITALLTIFVTVVVQGVDVKG